MSASDLVVLGDCNPDLLLRGDVVPAFGQVEQIVDEARLTIGGSGAIVAAGAARLGLRTALVAVVGDDVFGRFQLEALGQRGVDLRGVVVDRARPTGLSVLLTRGDDRAILTSIGTIDQLRGELVAREVLLVARHVHVSSYFLQARLRPDLPALFAEVQDAGLTTSLDTNWDPSDGWEDGLDALLPLVDCFFPNAAEARLIAGEESVEAAAASLARRVNVVAVTLGGDGAIAVSGDTAVKAPALAVDVVDTTGAGDSFIAGFLVGHLRGWPLERTLRLACACGSLSTTQTGGVDAQPTVEQALGAIESRA
jgi:sugar/nucleoside kinase (ribokinase family)